MTQSTRKASGIVAHESQFGRDLRAGSQLREHLRGCGSLRQQIAITRTLLDELEDSVPLSPLPPKPSVQVIEELIRLGCRVLDAAAVLAQRQEAEGEDSLHTRLIGSHARAPEEES